MEAEILEQSANVGPPPLLYTIAHQKVEIEIDFSREIRGTTEITIYPETKDLQSISLHSRHCEIKNVSINGLNPSSVVYEDPCDELCLHTKSNVHQHHILSSKLQGAFTVPPKEDLLIGLPANLKIVPVNLAEVHTLTAGTIKIQKPEDTIADSAETIQGLADTTIAKFTPLTVIINFTSIHLRDALQFVSGSGRWPHVYTRGGFEVGKASSLFPCTDAVGMRCTWEFSIKFPRTVGAASRQMSGEIPEDSDAAEPPHYEREMIVVCTGDVTDEIVDKADPSRKTVSFASSNQLSAQQIGFAIGPFERVNLAEFRDAQEIEELGKNAVEMIGYCLPGRTDDVKNTCLPTTYAMDFFVKRYIACPYVRFGFCFVEDMPDDPAIFAEIAVCGNQMLYPEDVIDPAQEITRSLVHTIASQWIGVNIVAEEPRDNWVIIGASRFMTDLFMKDLCGNNEYRYRMKKQSDKVVDLDQERPSIYEMGTILHVDPSVYTFMVLKCPVVFFVLDRRMAKVTGTGKMPAILGKILTRARTDDLPNNALSTDYFQKMVERFYHQRIDDFMIQWVKGAGCPRFQATQRFNKKKLVIELQIRQIQATQAVERELEVETFMRDVREDFNGVWAAEPQKVFTGPMTIRIHEADGTPYEHIVEIKDAVTTVDIPYNTKYKRLKRTKKQKSRVANKVTGDGEEEGDSLLYCLGDVLQTEEDAAFWKLTDWTAEEEEKMSSESFEWMRLDADFEWIAHTKIIMGGHMFVSQLQQDRDVIAQLDSVHTLALYAAQSLVSTILLRTMMDSRYFHGIRSAAAEALVKHARKEVNYIGLFHLKKAFEVLYSSSENGTSITRPNDFSNQLSYYLQGSLVEAISKVRDDKGVAPMEVKEFLLDKLRFNDNSANEYSDAFYVSRLMRALTQALLARPKPPADANEEIEVWTEYNKSQQIEQASLEEIDRYRRMDEWTGSFQNLYSRTALDCQAVLSRAGIGSVQPLYFLPFTRPGNYVALRITAYDVLIRSKLFETPSVLRYILHCMAADSSAHIRECLRAFFGKALAKKAIGESKAEAQAEGTGLVVEGSEEINLEAQQKEKARRQTVDGAMEALKKELGHMEDLKGYIWAAVCYPECGYGDLKPLLEFCKLLYDPVDKAVVKLDLPRYWKVKNLGNGKLVFNRMNKVRTRVMPIWKPKIQTQTAAARPLKLNFKPPKANSSTPTPPPLAAPPSQPGRIVLKLKKQGSE